MALTGEAFPEPFQGALLVPVHVLACCPAIADLAGFCRLKAFWKQGLHVIWSWLLTEFDTLYFQSKWNVMNEGECRTVEAFFKSWKEIVNRKRQLVTDREVTGEARMLICFYNRIQNTIGSFYFWTKDFFPSPETEGNEVRMGSWDVGPGSPQIHSG